MSSKYYCYIIVSKSHNNYTYVGTTNNLEKRLDQHNGKLKGGAKATKKYDDWEYYKIIEFNDNKNAMRFEWYMKHYKTTKEKWIHVKSGLNNKLKRLNELVESYNCIIIK